MSFKEYMKYVSSVACIVLSLMMFTFVYINDLSAIATAIILLIAGITLDIGFCLWGCMIDKLRKFEERIKYLEEQNEAQSTTNS